MFNCSQMKFLAERNYFSPAGLHTIFTDTFQVSSTIPPPPIMLCLYSISVVYLLLTSTENIVKTCPQNEKIVSAGNPRRLDEQEKAG